MSKWIISGVVCGSLFFSYLYCQFQYEYGIGIDFSGFEIDRSTYTQKLSENKMISKIIEYFFSSPEEDFDVKHTTTTQKLIDEIKKLPQKGFGNREIIRLILIFQKVSPRYSSLHPIVEIYFRRKSMKGVAEKFKLNYEDIWLESNKIYNQLCKDKKE